MICIYHNADLDGHCSGALVKLKFPSATMIGMNYGDKLPEISKGEKIYIVDFHLDPFEDMLKLMDANYVVWIDHHKTAIEDYIAHKEDIEYMGAICCLSNVYAACENTWVVLHPKVPIPQCVILLGRYDIWDHTDPNVLPFQFGIRLKPTEPSCKESMKFWYDLLYIHALTNEIIQDGKVIIRYIDAENAKICARTAYSVKFEGLNCIACNRSMTSSKLFDSIIDEYDAMLTYHFNGRHWIISLYSTELDVSGIAKARGGGGHAKACGFTCDELPKELLMVHK